MKKFVKYLPWIIIAVVVIFGFIFWVRYKRKMAQTQTTTTSSNGNGSNATITATVNPDLGLDLGSLIGDRQPDDIDSSELPSSAGDFADLGVVT